MSVAISVDQALGRLMVKLLLSRAPVPQAPLNGAPPLPPKSLLGHRVTGLPPPRTLPAGSLKPDPAHPRSLDDDQVCAHTGRLCAHRACAFLM